MPISNGLFICSHDEVEKFTCEPFIESGNASHKATWGTFGNLLKYISKNFGTSAPNEVFQEALGDITKLEVDLGGEFSFMTDFRNSLNYKVGHGIWYPQTSKAKKEWEIYKRLLDFDFDILEAPTYISRNNSQSQKFLGIARFIIDLCIWAMNDISKTNVRNQFLNAKSSRLVSYLTA